MTKEATTRITEGGAHRQITPAQPLFPYFAWYALLYLLRGLKTVNEPSSDADTFRYIPASPRSSRFAMKGSVALCSLPPVSEKCSCHMSSSPGMSWSSFQASGSPPLRAPLSITITRGAKPYTDFGETVVA